MIFMAPPEAIGLPKKYTAWRRNQAEAILNAVGNDKRVMLSICPTGFGKSLMYVAAGIILGGRTVILTSTKALQSQLMADFEEIGMVDVRGKNSYRCKESKDRLTCDEGLCNYGMMCPLRRGGCDYYDAIARARLAPLVVTNYAFWLYSNEYSEGIGTPKLLVCDEGHDAPDEVASFLEVKLSRSDSALAHLLPLSPQDYSMTEWQDWADHHLENVTKSVEDLMVDIKEYGPDEQSIKELSKLKRLAGNLTKLANMDVNNWVVNIDSFSIDFAPIWVRDKCQAILFNSVPKVIITSASVNWKTAEMLGITDNTCTMDEYEHTFPVESRLVYLVKGARMNAKTDSESLREWINTADMIIGDRLDRKGIFHTTAYHRQEFVMAHSKYARYMMGHARKDIIAKIQEFKQARPPKILVSPSVTTGFDFPYTDTEYQILGKVPYPDSRNVITKARMDADKDYAPYVAMQQIIQACGRGSRAEDDQCETFIIDDNIEWFLKRYRKFAPKWFMDSVTSRIFAPPPPKKLERRGA